MKNIILIIIILPLFSFSQGWEKIYDNGTGQSVQQTVDGGYIIAGTKYISESTQKVQLIKTDDLGDTIWTKTYGNMYYNRGNHVCTTIDGGYIVCGSTRVDSIINTYLIKVNEFGDTLWTRIYSGNNGYSICQTYDSGYIITGSTNNFSDVYLLKTDSLGYTLWTKTYGGSNNDWGLSVKQTNDSGYIITGTTYINDTIKDEVYLIKTDKNGDTVWTKTYGGLYNDNGFSVEQTLDGGYIIIGNFSPSISEDKVYLIKTNQIGDTIWTKKYGEESRNYGYSLDLTIDGGYILSGLTAHDGYPDNVYLIKTDDNGDTLWTRIFGQLDSSELGRSVQQTLDGGYIISGKTNEGIMGYKSVYLIKTDYNGNTVYSTELTIPNPNRKLIKLIDLSGREINSPQKKSPYIEVYDDGSTQKKLNLK